jgi:hypothetical protein
MNRPTRTRNPLGTILLMLVALPLALITLLGLAPLPVFPDSINGPLIQISQGLVQIVTIVGAIAVIVGILNLLGVHMSKLPTRQGLYSAITIITFLAVLVIHLVERFGIFKVSLPAGVVSDTPLISLTLIDVVQVVIETALSGMLFFFLVFAAYRLMRRNVTAWSLLFVATLVIILIGFIQPSGTLLANLREWMLRVPVSAGTRGLLIGIAIGTVTVGVRVLIGQDRLFRE